MDVQEDDYPDGGDEQRRDDENVPPLVMIGEYGNGNIQHKHSSRGRDRVKLSLHGAEAEGVDNGRGKECDAIPRNDESKVRETTEDDLEILEDPNNVPPGLLSVELRVAELLSEPGLDKYPLVIGQPLCFFRKVSNEEEHDNSQYNGYESL